MDFEWIDSAGKLQKGRNGIRGWFKTNSKGEATAGLGVGTHSFVFNSNDWTYRKIVPVASDKPLIVEFHRD